MPEGKKPNRCEEAPEIEGKLFGCSELCTCYTDSSICGRSKHRGIRYSWFWNRCAGVKNTYNVSWRAEANAKVTSLPYHTAAIPGG